MRKFFNVVLLGLLVVTGLGVSGCSKPQTEGLQTYTLYKHKVQVAPPKGWKVRQEKSPDNKEDIAAVVFEPPDAAAGKGHIAITATDGIVQTQEFMNQLYNGIRARQGKMIGKPWYEHKLNDPDKENAFHMEYELNDPGVGRGRQKGMQVQIFTKDKVLYSLVFTADPEVYDANRGTFLEVVKSFELAPQ